MVKNMAVWVKDDVHNMLPIVQKQGESSTPPVTLLNGEVISDGSSQPVAAFVGSLHD